MTMRKLLTNSRSIKALPGLAALCAAAPAGAVQCTANQINGRWAFFADDAEGDGLYASFWLGNGITFLESATSILLVKAKQSQLRIARTA
jgi:hypothetical protein